MPLDLSAELLRLPLRQRVSHASAARSCGASVWVRARRGGEVGLGEGCPREYVTREGLEQSVEQVQAWRAALDVASEGLDALQAYRVAHRAAIEAAPSAWCAVESALLDLLARERGERVEALLGLEALAGAARYTAVLTNEDLPRSEAMIDRYLVAGMRDFKLKLCGERALDRARLSAVRERGGAQVRLRVDANNLWAGELDAASAYLEDLLEYGIFAVEEPLEARDYAGLATLSQRLDVAMVLDESFTTARDLEQCAAHTGRFIANIKLSKVGGVLTALELVKALEACDWPLVIGAHVGESSLLTRVAWPVARAAGSRLVAHEGGFGAHLLERDAVSPTLSFGARGEIALEGSVGALGWGLSEPEAAPPTA